MVRMFAAVRPPSEPRAEEARGQAEFEFERVGNWREIPDEISDPEAYAVRHAKFE